MFSFFNLGKAVISRKPDVNLILTREFSLSLYPPKLGNSPGKFICAYLHHLGILKFQTQVHFHITHYPPLNLVLNVNFGSRWTKREIIFQEHLLILLCSQIHTDSDNLHSNETWRARQCPQVFICHHPLLSSWVEFNYPTTLGVAMPDVRC